MTIQYASDLHLEFSENKEFLRVNPIQPIGEILILAGDIVPFREIDKHKDFFDYLSHNFKKIYWVPGNHEYYGFDLADKCGTFNEAIRHNLFLINNLSLAVGAIKFIFSSLWSRISEENAVAIQHQLNDFTRIKYKNNPLKVTDYNGYHKESLHFLERELSLSKHPKKVVVTHHVPTFKNYPIQYRNSPLNEAFATELESLMEKTTPACWIYGHNHSNIPNFTIGKTELCSNQLGYVAYNEHLGFEPNKTITF
jgi:predicted phosphohydrolase